MEIFDSSDGSEPSALHEGDRSGLSASIPVVDPVQYEKLKAAIYSAVADSSLPQWARGLFTEAYEALDIMGTKRWEIQP